MTIIFRQALYHTKHDIVVYLHSKDFYYDEVYSETQGVIPALAMVFHELGSKDYFHDDLEKIIKFLLDILPKHNLCTESNRLLIWKYAIINDDDTILLKMLFKYGMILTQLTFTELFIAVKNYMNVNQFEILLKKCGANINMLLPCGPTRTMFQELIHDTSIGNNKVEMAKYLINNGAVIQDDDIYFLIETHNYDYHLILYFLCYKGLISDDHMSLLWDMAIRYNHSEILAFLRAKKIKPTTRLSTNLLILAIQYNNIDLVRELIMLGAEVNGNGIYNGLYVREEDDNDDDVPIHMGVVIYFSFASSNIKKK